MKQHHYQEAIEILKSIGHLKMAAYTTCRNSGHHEIAADYYEKACMFNCAAQFLQEGSPGGLSGGIASPESTPPPQKSYMTREYNLDVIRDHLGGSSAISLRFLELMDIQSDETIAAIATTVMNSAAERFKKYEASGLPTHPIKPPDSAPCPLHGPFHTYLDSQNYWHVADVNGQIVTTDCEPNREGSKARMEWIADAMNAAWKSQPAEPPVLPPEPEIQNLKAIADACQKLTDSVTTRMSSEDRFAAPKFVWELFGAHRAAVVALQLWHDMKTVRGDKNRDK